VGNFVGRRSGRYRTQPGRAGNLGQWRTDGAGQGRTERDAVGKRGSPFKSAAFNRSATTPEA
jgi:hypothetical protein